MIVEDPGLARNISTSEIGAGGEQRGRDERDSGASPVEGTGVANDGSISVIDVRDLNAYLRTNTLR